MAQIGVIYLCRFAEGERPVRRFVDSYRARPAGLEHDLHVIFKGFPGTTSLSAAQALFADLPIHPIHPIELEDKGFDIGSYFASARLVANPRLIFFNTFAELLADDWLKKFDTALDVPGIGVVGATASWQSPKSLYGARLKRGLHWVGHPLDYLNYLHRLRAKTLDANDCRAPQRSGTAGEAPSVGARQMFGRITGSLYDLLRFDHYLLHYVAYPNPHIRTNAFMIERDRFLALRSSSFRTKFDVYKFESGRQSLTRQILEQDLRPVVIGCDGHVYDMADWKLSSTYWTNQQANLIVGDNRTREYSEGSQQFRARLQAHAREHPSSWSREGGL